MAKEEADDLDLGEEKSGKKKMIIIIAIAVVVLLGGGAAAYFLLFSGDESEEAVTEEAAEEKAAAEDAEKGPLLYHDLKPVFVANMPGKPKLLQVGVNVRVRGDAMVEFLKHNDPMIRHHLLDLLSAKDGKSLKERSAKEALQKEMLDELNRIAEELNGPGDIEALFFTSFVMQ
ncbi:MAG: flagellar basal body-associated FliL family protein [gamma proteobacterium endosymbiont of Lamellibrachia anaximandri]|nr:flagellar basal body-associated FliL family protein [gamma proteobacterium endosymbiont of Lamellibrachia anaximandri]MBL3534940.1 flagellar basal body-associated FliL family protein [gamma proteobacterium endosymbiont of Lamellibrachia anaximandri]